MKLRRRRRGGEWEYERERERMGQNGSQEGKEITEKKGKKEEKGENRIGRSDRGGRVNETVCVEDVDSMWEK